MSDMKVTPGLLPNETVVEVFEFNNNGYWPRLILWESIWCSTVIGIPFMVCVPCCLSSWLKNRHVELTEVSIHTKTGWLTREEHSVPLERIQDVNILQGPLDRCFGSSNVQVQTAGSGKDGVEISLFSLQDPQHVRRAIFEQREKRMGLVRNENFISRPPLAQISGNEKILLEIRDAVKNIETIFSKK